MVRYYFLIFSVCVPLLFLSLRLEAIALMLEAIALGWRPSLVGWRPFAIWLASASLSLSLSLPSSLFLFFSLLFSEDECELHGVVETGAFEACGELCRASPQNGNLIWPHPTRTVFDCDP